MNLTSLPQAYTQIVYLKISPDHKLSDNTSSAGQVWSATLDTIEKSEGYQRLYWGRSVEYPQNVQLHIVRASHAEHQSSDVSFLDRLHPILKEGSKPVVRHVAPMTTFTSSPTTAFDAPVTGTAIYVRTTEAWHEGSWPCWTHIVRHVAGNSGISGGPIAEALSDNDVLEGGAGGLESGKGADLRQCYLVYVGWDSIKAHDDYHHTKHFRDHRVVLGIGNSGYREYGHQVFEGWRSKERKDTESASGSSKL
ncbi:hypothetical protein H2198_008057 [Neophaeococcomyces mojaviensis]|uniref:Uncharacterized protein n=1 Tax=Neophaeococcomyces mojaviensis TaxID=3383035 RepID=A0ACC2ZY58_9EURO|nr:hypothetical protein H2198_008057 [Knufia sp. JES_112]